MSKKMPLEGLRVLELGNFVAAPFTGKILAEFGAEVIKVEDPSKGDPLRSWRKQIKDTSLWWYVQGRNKKSITVNLREPQGQSIIKRLIPQMDVVLENFKPGVLERWGLGYEELKMINPSIVMTRISGYGQTGPYRDKAGFGSVAESIGGLRNLTGYPDRPPTRVGIAIGDLVSGLYAVIGTLMALRARDKLANEQGQVVDVALYESVFSLLEEGLPEYYITGEERKRTGSTLPGVAPTNTYQCKDGKYLIIGGNGDKIFQRLMNTIGRPDLANDPRFANNQGRVEHSEFIDATIESWTKQHTLQEANQILDNASVPCGPIYGMKDIIADEHYQARDMIREVEVESGKKLLVPGIVPKLSETPGDILWNGPKLGEHNEEIFSNYLGMTSEEISRLKAETVI
ncbi:CoA transferase [Caldibacillus lycopersici]|uniref:CoA transferase n=1 Tax=Perspicuibacillus lycopersici TaxID=1325689 RepID=A0AAE3IR39_9BACI|nr:CaiB/BaiF CoA-transferase family protein [Perspicuibacillus lycopersici]MCU9612647.1 CoA transferase [Perspicuibacillus lycopersici]